MTTTKLQIYNTALTEYLGTRKLASISEARSDRYDLDDAWDAGLVDECLHAGQWKFATRVAQLSYNPSVTPSFGHTRAFDKPDDFVRLVALCSDEFYKSTLMEYEEEAGMWFCSLDDIYIKYVSNDNAYGNDMSLWPPNFVSYVAATLAAKKAKKITGSDKIRDDMMKLQRDALSDSLTTDAMAGPPKFAPPGRWAMSRSNGWGNRDRGNISNLIG